VSLRPPFLAFVRGVRIAQVITMSSGCFSSSCARADDDPGDGAVAARCDLTASSRDWADAMLDVLTT
jgi:hypothetical protein